MSEILTDGSFLAVAGAYLFLSGLIAYLFTGDWWSVWAVIFCPLIASAMATFLVSQVA